MPRRFELKGRAFITFEIGMYSFRNRLRADALHTRQFLFLCECLHKITKHLSRNAWDHMMGQMPDTSGLLAARCNAAALPIECATILTSDRSRDVRRRSSQKGCPSGPRSAGAAKRAQSIAGPVGSNDPDIAVVEGKQNFLRKTAAAMQEDDWNAM